MYPDQPIQHGKTLNKISLEEFFAEKDEWYRYRDYDQDGVAYRTIPGTDHPRSAYFARGTGHNDKAIYSERSDDWIQNMERLRRKFETARAKVPAAAIDYDANKKIGIISFGSNDPAIKEAQDRLAEDGIETNYLRVRALPLKEEVRDFVLKHERIYVIENNFDGQLFQLLRMEIAEDTTHMRSVALGDGLPMTPRWVYSNILEEERK